jgi:hypothetical protein
MLIVVDVLLGGGASKNNNDDKQNTIRGENASHPVLKYERYCRSVPLAVK